MWRVLVVSCCVCAERQLERPRVYLGEEDVNKEFPFVVSIQDRYGIRQCSSTLIARNWILTAGHCVDFSSKLLIRYANFTLNPLETRAYRRVIKFFRHPSYFSYETKEGYLDKLTNDMALALIEKVPKGQRIGKLSAIDYKALLGLPVEYAGFGYNGEDSEYEKERDEFKPLQVGKAVVMKCEPEMAVFSPSICVAPRCSNRFQDTRPGDSGSPLMHRGRIVGVLIGGAPPISEFTPVSPNLGWITDVIKRHKKSKSNKDVK